MFAPAIGQGCRLVPVLSVCRLTAGQATLLLQRRQVTGKQRGHNSTTLMVEKTTQGIDRPVQLDGSEAEIALPNPPGRAHFGTADHVGTGLEAVVTNIPPGMCHHRSKECVLALMGWRLTMDLCPECASLIWKACWSLVSAPGRWGLSCLATKVLPQTRYVFNVNLLNHIKAVLAFLIKGAFNVIRLHYLTKLWWFNWSELNFRIF